MRVPTSFLRRRSGVEPAHVERSTSTRNALVNVNAASQDSLTASRYPTATPPNKLQRKLLATTCVYGPTRCDGSNHSTPPRYPSGHPAEPLLVAIDPDAFWCQPSRRQLTRRTRYI